MAGSLVHIGSAVASGSAATLSITGIDSTYNVYMVQVKNIVPASDDTIGWRITKGGSIQSDSEYDNARQDMPITAGFQDNEAQNADGVTNANIESTGDGFFATFYLFNFSNASEYSFATFEAATSDTTIDFRGNQGGGVHTVASASDGINVFLSTGGNIDSGEFKLYGLRK